MVAKRAESSRWCTSSTPAACRWWWTRATTARTRCHRCARAGTAGVCARRAGRARERRPAAAPGATATPARCHAAAPSPSDAARLQPREAHRSAEALLDEHLESIVAAEPRRRAPSSSAARRALTINRRRRRSPTTLEFGAQRTAGRRGTGRAARRPDARAPRAVHRRRRAPRGPPARPRPRADASVRAHGVAQRRAPGAASDGARRSCARTPRPAWRARPARTRACPRRRTWRAWRAHRAPLPAYPDSVGDWVEPVEERHGVPSTAEAREEVGLASPAPARQGAARRRCSSAGACRRRASATGSPTTTWTTSLRRPPIRATRSSRRREKNNAERDERATNENLADASVERRSLGLVRARRRRRDAPARLEV